MKQSTKNLLLAAGFVLVFGLAWEYSFSKTLDLKKELEELELQTGSNSASLRDLDFLQQKEIYLDSIIAKNRIGSTSLQNNLLKVLNEFSKEYNYKIISFKEPHVRLPEDGSGHVSSFRVVLQGEYRNLEKILYLLENNYSFGSLAHISFEKKKDYAANKDYLQCHVVVQNIK